MCVYVCGCVIVFVSALRNGYLQLCVCVYCVSVCIVTVYVIALVSQQHTTLHPTAGLALMLRRVSPGQSLDGKPDAA